MKFLEKYGQLIMIVLLVLVLFRSCGTGSEVTRVKKQVEELKSTTISREQMIKLINETPAWKNLEIEELSDKNHVPINFYKNQNLVDTSK
jgi:hypothetical protein